MEKKNSIDRVMFIGSKQLGYESLYRMFRLAPHALCGCITFDDRKDDRNCYDLIKGFCEKNKIPCYCVSGKCDISQIIIENKPDICFVIGWYFIIQKEILDMVPFGFVGIHASLLPAYRGHAPLVWAMINGERETGYSVFKLEDGVDIGDILYSEKIRIEEEDYISDVLEKVENSVLHFWDKRYGDILKGRLSWRKQEGEGSFAAKRIEADGKIDWEKDAQYLYNFIRAQSCPYPGAYTIFKENKLIIWKAKKAQGIFYGTCGQVAYIDMARKTIGVICGENSALEIEQVEYQGNKCCPTEIVKLLNIRFQWKGDCENCVGG